MSYVTNHILAVSLGDGEELATAINAALEDVNIPSRLVALDPDCLVGPKYFEMDVLVVAFNYVEEDKWTAIVERCARPIREREDHFSCQLLTCYEGEDFFVEVLRL